MDEHQRTVILAAISNFKDWSNALVVTTTVALGWVSTTKGILNEKAYKGCLYAFALSIVFGIATLAMIPLVTEAFTDPSKVLETQPSASEQSLALPSNTAEKHVILSFYDVTPTYYLFYVIPIWFTDLKWFCFWQHLLFLAGILIYARGAQYREDKPPEATISFSPSPEQLEKITREARTAAEQVTRVAINTATARAFSR